jgi:hypothetical protein
VKVLKHLTWVMLIVIHSVGCSADTLSVIDAAARFSHYAPFDVGSYWSWKALVKNPDTIDHDFYLQISLYDSLGFLIHRENEMFQKIGPKSSVWFDGMVYVDMEGSLRVVSFYISVGGVDTKKKLDSLLGKVRAGKRKEK